MEEEEGAMGAGGAVSQRTHPAMDTAYHWLQKVRTVHVYNTY